MSNNRLSPYEIARNALIPEAKATADKKCGLTEDNSKVGKADWSAKWTRCFMSEMDRLARIRGVVT